MANASGLINGRIHECTARTMIQPFSTMMTTEVLLLMQLFGLVEHCFQTARSERAVWESACLPGPTSVWARGSEGWPQIIISLDGIGAWPCSVGALVKLSAFLASLHWPVTG